MKLFDLVVTSSVEPDESVAIPSTEFNFGRCVQRNQLILSTYTINQLILIHHLHRCSEFTCL